MNKQPLWKQMSHGDEDARQALLAQHIGLVHFVARQVSRNLGGNLEFDELVSVGTLGLISALEAFEPNRGLAFSTFATPRIRGAILDELRRIDHVPRSVRRKTRAINAARDTLGHATGKTPSDRETAEHLGVDLQTLWRWQADIDTAVHMPLHSHMSLNEDSTPMSTEVLAAQDENDIEERISHDQEVAILRESILHLKDQERVVLSLYYFEDLRMHEIATILDLTESRVSQIRSQALRHLRVALSSLRENVA